MKTLIQRMSIYGVAGLIPSFFLFSHLSLAQTPENSTGSGAFKNPFAGTGINTVPDFIDTVIGLLINLGAVIVVFFVVFAGFRFVIAQGNPEKIQEAKKILFYTLVGGAILIGAKVISEVIKTTVEQF
jgi:succinate dehydrogenase/fumarate reductase cytochrome b subunit